MNNKVAIGKVDFILLAAMTSILSIFLAFILPFIFLPIVYLICFVFLYKGYLKARGVIVVMNILSAFADMQITYGDQMLGFLWGLVVPIVLLRCTVGLFSVNVKAFINYQVSKKFEIR